MILDELISTVLQILAFALIPIIIYLIRYRRKYSLAGFVGLKSSPANANLIAFFASLVFVFSSVGLYLLDENIRQTLLSPESMTGKFRQMGFGTEALLMVLITALFKTALSEELFFRGFVAKRLISLMGFRNGNLLQAILFGGIHILLFLFTPDTRVIFYVFIFLISGLGAYISGYLNERVADGSIVPGWIMHGVGNLVSYSLIGFVLE